MSIRITVIAGMVALVALCLMAALERAPTIEKDIRTRAQRALGPQSLDIQVQGRDITLTGTVANEAEKAAAGSRLEAVAGVRRVSNRIFVTSAGEQKATATAARVNYNYTLAVRDNGSVVEVRGNVPNDLSRQRIMTIIYTAAIGKEVRSGQLSTAGVDSPRANAWDEAARKSLQVAVALAQLEFELRDETLTIGGLAEDEAQRAKIVEDLQQFGGERRFNVDVIMSQIELCQSEINQHLSRQAIVFAPASGELTPDSAAALDMILGALWQCPTARIRIIDYASSSDTELAQTRVNSVARYLVAQGIVATRLVVQPGANPASGPQGQKLITISIGPSNL